MAVVMRASAFRLLITTLAVTMLCGVLSRVASARMLGPRVPAGTPTWLTTMIQRVETVYGDRNPETIVVRLGVSDRYGRKLDRVWMRGTFSCADCTTGLATSAWQDRVIGFTVFADSHRLLSISLHHR
jgi:hypothetical protein